MVVHVVDIDCRSVLEPKRHAPVARHRYRVVSFHVALQFVQPQARQVHAFRSPTAIKNCQDVPQLPHMRRSRTPRRSPLVECLQTAMAKRCDHSTTVARRLSVDNRWSWTTAWKDQKTESEQFVDSPAMGNQSIPPLPDSRFMHPTIPSPSQCSWGVLAQGVPARLPAPRHGSFQRQEPIALCDRAQNQRAYRKQYRRRRFFCRHIGAARHVRR